MYGRTKRNRVSVSKCTWNYDGEEASSADDDPLNIPVLMAGVIRII